MNHEVIDVMSLVSVPLPGLDHSSTFDPFFWVGHDINTSGPDAGADSPSNYLDDAIVEPATSSLVFSSQEEHGSHRIAFRDLISHSIESQVPATANAKPACPKAPVMRRQDRRRLASLNDSCLNWLANCVAAHRITSPWTDLLLQDVKSFLARTRKQSRDLFLKMWIGTCSAASIIALRNAVQMLRNESNWQVQFPLHGLLLSERMQLIDKTEAKMAGLALLRRLHLVRLWEDYQTSTSKNGRWISSGPPHSTRSARKPGNPRHEEESLVTSSLLRDMLPNVEEDSPEYYKAYAKFKRLRKLGQRFSMLQSRFGQGILGLLPCSDAESPANFSCTISDSLYVGLSFHNIYTLTARR